jgi:hypothetical protein
VLAGVMKSALSDSIEMTRAKLMIEKLFAFFKVVTVRGNLLKFIVDNYFKLVGILEDKSSF